jgi:hypothetical protein
VPWTPYPSLRLQLECPDLPAEGGGGGTDWAGASIPGRPPEARRRQGGEERRVVSAQEERGLGAVRWAPFVLVTERDVRPRLGLQARPAPVAGFLSVLVRPVPSPDGADAVDAEEGEGGRERFGDERVERVVRAGFQLGGARRRVAPRLVLRAPKATPAAQETSSENQRVRERERARGREREGERERERERDFRVSRLEFLRYRRSE